jgi:hypothetical protein
VFHGVHAADEGCWRNVVVADDVFGELGLQQEILGNRFIGEIVDGLRFGQ